METPDTTTNPESAASADCRPSNCSHRDDPTKSDPYLMSGSGVLIKYEEEQWMIEAEICYGSGYVAKGETLAEAIQDLVRQTCDDAKRDEAIAWYESK